jgi:glycerophosphoryl diester phosphodiesterase
LGVCAHENTLAAFQEAIELGVDSVELDAVLCVDDEICVFHDEQVKDTTLYPDFKLKENFTADERAQYDIPTLESVLRLCKDQVFVNIELKQRTKPELKERVTELVKHLGMENVV